MTPTKRLGIAFALAAAILAAPNVAKAANEYQIRSHGTLVMKNADNSQYVEFYSEDIRYLQRELDKLFAELPGDYSAGTAAVSYSAVPTQKGYTAQEYIEETESIVTE